MRSSSASFASAVSPAVASPSGVWSDGCVHWLGHWEEVEVGKLDETVWMKTWLMMIGSLMGEEVYVSVSGAYAMIVMVSGET